MQETGLASGTDYLKITEEMMHPRNVAFMSAYSIDKWISKLKRIAAKRRMTRKNYRKSRFKRAKARDEKYLEDDFD